MESTLEAALKDWKEREQRYEKLFSPSVLKSREFLKEKLRHYDQLRTNELANPTPGQSLALKALELERRQLARKVYPNIFSRLIERLVSNFRIGNDITKLQERQEDNNESLRTAMDKAGLGQYFSHVQQQMNRGKSEIALPVSYQVNEHERVDLLINIKKDNHALYQLENYKASLYSTLEKGKPREHTFSSEHNGLLSADKAYNLLAGRAVQQAGSASWQQLDFNDKDASGNYRMKHFNEGYGYDMEKALSALSLKGVDNDLMAYRLRQGDKITASILVSGKEHTISLSADPLRKDIAIYDNTGQKVTVEQLKDVKSKANVKELFPEKRESNQVKVKGVKL